MTTSPSSGAGPQDAPLATELRVAAVHFVRRLRLERSREDISDAQYAVLATLQREGPRTPGELAAREHVQPPSMTRTIAALADAGLVVRGEHPHDRRQVVVAVTDAGAAAVVETRRRRDQWLARRLDALAPQERDTVARAAEILRRLSQE